jgi:predicted transposase YdaD
MQFDWFIDTVPEVIERVKQAKKSGLAEGEARGKVEGRAEGKLEGALQEARQMVLDVSQLRFPALLLFAQTQISVITQPTQLRKLALDLIQASDEAAAIHLLTAIGKKA